MEKDKEAVALFLNKRQEIRCSQLISAVNKEQILREREFSHEIHYFKNKLWKLVQKRKELNLDPARTREMEIVLNPALGKKLKPLYSRANQQRVRVSPSSETVSGVSNNEIFVTKTVDQIARVSMSPSPASKSNQLHGHNMTLSKYPILPAAKSTKPVAIVGDNKGDIECGIAVTMSNIQKTDKDSSAEKQEIHSSKVLKGIDPRDSRRRSFNEDNPRKNTNISQKVINNISGKPRFFKRSASDLNFKKSTI